MTKDKLELQESLQDKVNLIEQFTNHKESLSDAVMTFGKLATSLTEVEEKREYQKKTCNEIYNMFDEVRRRDVRFDQGTQTDDI